MKNLPPELANVDIYDREEILQVDVLGRSPGLLMNNPAYMLDEKKGTRKVTQKGSTVEVEAERSAYKTADGELYIPSEAIFRSLINAGTYIKSGKSSLKSFVSAGIRIFPREIRLGTSEYKIDLRTVVIQHARIVKARASIPEWKARFYVFYDPSIFVTDVKRNVSAIDLISEALGYAGQRIGILDFRPQHLGEFGRFVISGIKELDEE